MFHFYNLFCDFVLLNSGTNKLREDTFIQLNMCEVEKTTLKRNFALSPAIHRVTAIITYSLINQA